MPVGLNMNTQVERLNRAGELSPNKTHLESVIAQDVYKGLIRNQHLRLEDKVPDFQLNNEFGELVSAYEMLEDNELIVSFGGQPSACAINQGLIKYGIKHIAVNAEADGHSSCASNECIVHIDENLQLFKQFGLAIDKNESAKDFAGMLQAYYFVNKQCVVTYSKVTFDGQALNLNEILEASSKQYH